MKNSDKNMLLFVVMFLIAAMTVGGLGNAAVVYQKIYWIPCVINIFVYGYILYKLYKAGDKAKTSGKGGGAAHPAQSENEKEDTIVDKTTKTKKEGR